MTSIVVIGAGQAGASLVAKLRASGFDGDVTLIGAEPVAPYQRPPLSKGYLLGDMGLERLYLRAPSFWDEHGVTLKLGAPVTAIDRTARTVQVASATIRYDQLAFATGSRPRTLPPAVHGELGGVFTVRTIADVDAMAPRFTPGRRLLVVGGGYIGLEAAAVGAKLGLEVTLIEMAPRILQRVAAPETSRYFRALHEAHGVSIREGTGLVRLTGTGDVSGAELSDGTVLAVDVVVVGVGIEPETTLAEQVGLAIENGIRTDAQGHTSDPHIWAAGDCASVPYRGGRIRLESVGNAIDQGELVAANMLGAGLSADPKPWFWSDQYDVKLQIAGLNTGYDRVVTRPGDTGAMSVWYFAAERLLAVDAMRDPRAYMIGKRIIEAGQTVDPLALADPSCALKMLMETARNA